MLPCVTGQGASAECLRQGRNRHLPGQGAGHLLGLLLFTWEIMQTIPSRNTYT